MNKLSLDPSANEPRVVTVESLALSWWYDSHPAVRRLWGIKSARGLRVIVSVDPTHDNDDIFPAWLANSEAWTNELHFQTGCPVQLELVKEPLFFDGIEIDAGSVVVADLFWRDPTLNQPNEVL